MDNSKKEKFKLSIMDVRGDGSAMSTIVRGHANHKVLANVVISFARALKGMVPESIMHGLIALAYDDNEMKEFADEMKIDKSTRGGEENV